MILKLKDKNKMLFAVSGSQSSGKTTVLNLLKQHGYNIIERKTSRSILEEWGITLREVNNNQDLTIKFQEEIIKRKFEDEKHAVESSDIWFTERTFADLFTYALISLGKDNEFSEWLNDYFKKCKNYCKIYRSVFYLKAGVFAPVHDGVRGSNIHYSKMVDLVMYDFTRQMFPPCDSSIVDTIELVTPQERVEYIEYRVKKIVMYSPLNRVTLQDITKEKDET